MWCKARSAIAVSSSLSLLWRDWPGITRSHCARPIFPSQKADQGNTGPCPLRVNRVGLTLGQPLPVYPYERTSLDRPGWSGSCQHQTCDMRINAGAPGCLLAFHFRHRGASVSALRRLRGLHRHGISSGSGMQRPKQLRGLPDVGSFESFSKRRAHRAEQFATLPGPTLVSPKPRQADRRAQLKRFGGLASGRR